MACLSFPKAPIVILRVDFESNDMRESVPQLFPGASVETRAATGGAPGSPVTGDVLLARAVRASKKVWPQPALSRCLQFCWQETKYFYFFPSQKVRERSRVVRSWFIQPEATRPLFCGGTMPSLLPWILAPSPHSCSQGFNSQCRMWCVKHCWHASIPSQVLRKPALSF